MADYSREAVLDRSQQGESLERADLRDLVLSNANLENAKLRRADLEGVNFEEANLRHANLMNANLRDAYLPNADLEDAYLQKADLEGANLEGANLQNADLSRANLEGARLERANLCGARLNYAQMEAANLGGAILENVRLANADLREAYLGGANLTKADLNGADLERANLEEANLAGADLRYANLHSAKLSATVITGAKLYACELDVDNLVEVVAEWVDFSPSGSGERCLGSSLAEQYRAMKNNANTDSGASSLDQGKRFFGQGDVLRNASLEFGDRSYVEIESRFENCSIGLGAGAVVKLGRHGVLQGCQIIGFGDIEIQGEFRESGRTPGIVGARRVIVRKDGVLFGSIQQPPTMTEFEFEQGCMLQLRIQK